MRTVTSAQTTAVASAGSRRRVTTGSPLARAAPAAVAGLVACGLLVAMAWRQGGYFPEHHLVAGAVAFGTLGVLLAVWPPAHRLSTAALLAMGSLGALAVWAALSALWSSMPDTALQDGQLALVHAGILGLGVVAAGSGRYSRHLLWALLATLAIMVAAGLLSRLDPGLFEGAAQGSRFAGYRLAYPVGYWNAFGCLCAMTVVLGAGLAADPRSPAAARVLAAAVVVPAGVALYLSLSRGALLALLVGLVVLLAAGAHRTALLATLGVCAAGLLVAVGRLHGYEALTDDPAAGAGAVAEGRAYGGFLLGVVALTAAGQFMLTGRWMPRAVRETLPRRARPFVLTAGAVVVLAAAGFYAVRSADVEQRTAGGLVGAESWVKRQWDEFLTPATFSQTGSERLTSARGTRSDLYRVAIDGFEGRPLLGDGGGGFEVRFAHDREVAEKVRDAHSLYLELAHDREVERVGVGIAFLLTLVGAVVWAAIVARRRGDILSGSQTAAAAAAFAVWAAQAGVDWLWQVPTVTGAGLLAGAAMLPAGARRRRGRRRAGSRERL